MGKAVNEPRGLICLPPSPRFMPLDWKPPAKAWSASFAQQTTPVVMAYFGRSLNRTVMSDSDPKWINSLIVRTLPRTSKAQVLSIVLDLQISFYPLTGPILLATKHGKTSPVSWPGGAIRPSQ